MKTLGYVAQEGESEKYSLTLKLFELGARALQNVDLIRSADIQMREIPPDQRNYPPRRTGRRQYCLHPQN